MKIVDVRAFLAMPEGRAAPGASDVRLFVQPPRLTPSSVFYEPRHRDQNPGQTIGELIVEVETDDGLIGLGNVGAARGNALHTILHHLKPIVMGESPFDVELLWERMYRHTVKFGRKGVAIEAISGVDIALWDLMGKALRQPLYNLLGGRTRDRIRLYASRLYPSDDIDAIASEALTYAQQGFTAMKLRFGHGPQSGQAGMRRNLDLIRAVREAIGPDIELAADAHMGWDATYAIRMIRRIEDAGHELAWVEEPVMPDDIAGYAAIAAAVDTPIAGGEHEFTRHGFRDLIEQRAVDIVQLDVNRAGGITESLKIWALAAAHNLPVIPHAGQMHNYHLIMAKMNSPMAEYFPPPVSGCDSNDVFWEIFDGEPMAEAGYITLGDSSGLGLTLKPAVRMAAAA
jgi:L-rhamnonate dehydratase